MVQLASGMSCSPSSWRIAFAAYTLRLAREMSWKSISAPLGLQILSPASAVPPDAVGPTGPRRGSERG